MKGKVLNALSILSLLSATATIALWVFSYVTFVSLRSTFLEGRYDGDRQWYGYYFVACKGQLCFEKETIDFTDKPDKNIISRWHAEDAVGLRTETLRGFPYSDTILGFSFVNVYTPGPSGTLSTLSFSIPIWSLTAICGLG